MRVYPKKTEKDETRRKRRKMEKYRRVRESKTKRHNGIRVADGEEAPVRCQKRAKEME